MLIYECQQTKPLVLQPDRHGLATNGVYDRGFFGGQVILFYSGI
jgi:hypothetical protein